MKRRFFKTSNAEYQEFYILEIDEDFVTFQKFLFGHLISEKVRGIFFLEDNFPNYTDYSFDELRQLNPYEQQPSNIPDALLQHAISKGIDLNERIKNDWALFFDDINNVISVCEEVTDKCIYSDVLKIVIGDEDYKETEMIVPFLNGIVTIAIEGLELVEAETKYKKLKEQYHLLKPIIYQKLYNKFEQYKDDVDRPMETRIDRKIDAKCFPELKDINDIENIITPRFLSFGNFEGYTIRFDCSWDEEHGVELTISGSFEIEVM